MDYSNITGGLRVQTQIPLDVKQYSLSENDLKNLGIGNNLAFTYTKGLVIYCVQEETRWEWREVKLGEENTGLLSNDFVYPNGITAFGINYSLKSFNFFPFLINGQIGPQGPPGENGVSGPPGVIGPKGDQGIQGNSGTNGTNGEDGLSAYEVAVLNGFLGTESEWLISLIGPPGPQGDPTDLSIIDLQFVLNNLPTVAEINTDLDITASNFNFQSDNTALNLQNHLTTFTGNNNLIISNNDTSSGIVSGSNNVIIGNVSTYPNANNTVAILNGLGDIVLFFNSSSNQASLPLQTSVGTQAVSSRKGIITIEYLEDVHHNLRYVNKNANYNVSPIDGTIDCIANTFTVTLPNTGAYLVSKEFVIKNSGTGVITIDVAGGRLIDGSATVTLSNQYEKIRVQYTGSNYIII